VAAFAKAWAARPFRFSGAAFLLRTGLGLGYTKPGLKAHFSAESAL